MMTIWSGNIGIAAGRVTVNCYEYDVIGHMMTIWSGTSGIAAGRKASPVPCR